MKKFILFLLLIIPTTYASAQIDTIPIELDSWRYFGPKFKKGESKISEELYVKLLAQDKVSMELYRDYKTLDAISSFSLIGGTMLTMGGLWSSSFPQQFVYAGAACMVASIPLQIAAGSKLVKSLKAFNTFAEGGTYGQAMHLSLSTSQYGVGLRLSF